MNFVELEELEEVNGYLQRVDGDSTIFESIIQCNRHLCTKELSVGIFGPGPCSDLVSALASPAQKMANSILIFSNKRSIASAQESESSMSYALAIAMNEA